MNLLYFPPFIDMLGFFFQLQNSCLVFHYALGCAAHPCTELAMDVAQLVVCALNSEPVSTGCCLKSELGHSLLVREHPKALYWVVARHWTGSPSPSLMHTDRMSSLVWAWALMGWIQCTSFTCIPSCATPCCYSTERAGLWYWPTNVLSTCVILAPYRLHTWIIPCRVCHLVLGLFHVAQGPPVPSILS